MKKGTEGLSRRVVVIGGAAGIAGGLAGCGPAEQFDDALAPVAHWPEEEPMAPASPYSNPLVLYGQVLVNPNVDAAVPNVALSNPDGMPMELLEVRFRLVPQSSITTQNVGVTGLGLGVKMDLGKVAVVDSYVPVGDLGTSRDSYEYQQAVFSDPDSATPRAFPTTYGWRLKYPLLIPGGATLSCVLRSLGQSSYPLLVDVAYIARTWDMRRPLPTHTRVPWVSSYESRVFEYETGIAAKQDQSGQLDIINPFDAQLEIARFGGRLSYLVNYTRALGADYVLEDPVTMRDVFGTFRMRSSRGFDIVGNPSAFGVAFPYSWRSWDMGDKWLMSPREYYTVNIDTAAITDTVTAPYIGQMQYSIGLTGYRSVPVAALAE